MKFTIKKQILENTVSNIIPYLEKRDSSAITSHIFINVEENSISLKATDQEIGLSYTISQNINIKETGKVTANGKNLLDIIKSLKDGEISIYDENETLIIKQNKSLFKIAMQKADDYPNFPDCENKNKFDINATSLSNSLKKIDPCIDSNNANTVLSGALIDIKQDKINIVGSDGRRLGSLSLNISAQQEFQLLIPKKSIIEIQKIFNKEIEIFYDQIILVAKGSNFTFFTKLLNGKYADYEKIINQKFENKIVLQRDSMLESLKIVKILSDNVNIKFSKNYIEFKVLSNVGEEGKTELETNLDINNDYEINVKIKYLIDFLNNIETPDFSISYNDVRSQLLLESDNLKEIITQIYY